MKATSTCNKLESFTCPFSLEASSICIDIKSDHQSHQPLFTTEFNISDYFPYDSLTDFDFTLTPSSNITFLTNDDYKTDEIGCSHFLVLQESKDSDTICIISNSMAETTKMRQGSAKESRQVDAMDTFNNHVK